MDPQKLIEHATALRARIQGYALDKANGSHGEAAQAQVCEFLKAYAGPKSAFLKKAEEARGFDSHLVASLTSIMNSYIEYVNSGLAEGMSPERRAQIDVVSDILGQAQAMLDNTAFHPAAAAVLVGASLEEFLRNWVEAEGLSIGAAKPSLDAYCKVLRTGELLSKQDTKDITSWGGIRNAPAHGEWDQVADPALIRLMLEGVNLFLRKKTPGGT